MSPPLHVPSAGKGKAWAFPLFWRRPSFYNLHFINCVRKLMIIHFDVSTLTSFLTTHIHSNNCVVYIVLPYFPFTIPYYYHFGDFLPACTLILLFCFLMMKEESVAVLLIISSADASRRNSSLLDRSDKLLCYLNNSDIKNGGNYRQVSYFVTLFP